MNVTELVMLLSILPRNAYRLMNPQSLAEVYDTFSLGDKNNLAKHSV